MKINEHNYESYLLDFVDEELSEAEQQQLLAYLAAHPELEEELQLLQKTKPARLDSIAFSGKEQLYRSEANRKKVFIMPWRKVTVAVAAAASLLLIFTLYFNQKEEFPDRNRVAVTTNAQKSSLSKILKPEPKEESGNQEKETMEKKSKDKAHKRVNSIEPLQKPKHPAIIQIEVQPVRPGISQWATLSTIKIARPKLYKRSKHFKKNIKTTAQKNIATNTDNPITITSTLTKLRKNKNVLDSSLTHKVIALHEKITHPIKLLNIKKIKIGHLSFVFN